MQDLFIDIKWRKQQTKSNLKRVLVWRGKQVTLERLVSMVDFQWTVPKLRKLKRKSFKSRNRNNTGINTHQKKRKNFNCFTVQYYSEGKDSICALYNNQLRDHDKWGKFHTEARDTDKLGSVFIIFPNVLNEVNATLHWKMRR